MSRGVLDVAIVGGGVSGCYCGYRLLTADPAIAMRDLRKASGRDSFSVALYEAGDRIGGRLWSYRFPELPNQPAEMGGIGFSPLHANVYGLCTKELKLRTEQADEFIICNLQYLRHHLFAFADYSSVDRPDGHYPGTVPYFLNDAEKWQPPPVLMLSAFKKAVPEVAYLIDQLLNEGGDAEKASKIIRKLDLALRRARLPGTELRLYNYGYWNLLSKYMSQEALEMVTMSSGFNSTTQNWNAYNSILGSFDFFVPQPWWKLEGGYDALPEKLALRFTQLGGKIHTGTRLRGLEIQTCDGEVLIAMRLRGPDGCDWTERARNVILAIPQRSVRLLNQDTFLFRSGQFVDDLSTVTAEPAYKLFLTFAEPWWKRVASPPNQTKTFIEGGQSSTDLPMRLCYYLGSEKTGESLLLASFCDSIAVQYWNGYLPQSCFGLSDQSMGASRGHPSALLMDPPPAAMVWDAVRQLRELHNFDVPEPLSAAFVNWSADPYGGGYHFWNTHVRSWEVMPRIRHPVADANVFLCGEAFSAKQGWVEGSINTAEMILETYFGMSRPEWVPGDYDFGP